MLTLLMSYLVLDKPEHLTKSFRSMHIRWAHHTGDYLSPYRTALPCEHAHVGLKSSSLNQIQTRLATFPAHGLSFLSVASIGFMHFS